MANKKTPTAIRAIGVMSPGLVGKGCQIRELFLGSDSPSVGFRGGDEYRVTQKGNPSLWAFSPILVGKI
jgi:hypothetical protein